MDWIRSQFNSVKCSRYMTEDKLIQVKKSNLAAGIYQLEILSALLNGRLRLPARLAARLARDEEGHD
jgi:hypothetical protein